MMFLLASILLACLSGPAQAGEAAANDLCPVLTEEKIDPEIWIDWQGRRVYFCCERCQLKFLREPAKYAANLPALPAASPQQTEHEHAHNREHDGEHSEPHGFARLVRFLGKLHPPVVHFPIALLIAAALAELFHVRTRKGRFREAARFCVAAGAAMALLAAGLGWAAGESGNFSGALGEAFDTHRWLGISTAATALVAALFSERSERSPGPRARSLYLAFLFLSASLAAAAGYFGGLLVFGLDHFRW